MTGTDEEPTIFRQGDPWASVAEVAEAVEAEIDLLVTIVENVVMSSVWATSCGTSPALQAALHRGISAGARDALARIRCHTELPQQLQPDLTELARMCSGSTFILPATPDPWLMAQEAFWDRFEVVAERTLADTALCWEVTKVARARLKGHAVRVSQLFRTACERERTRATSSEAGSRLEAVLRALAGQWVDPGELDYDLAGHHVAVVGAVAPLLDVTARETERRLLRVRARDGASWGWLGGNTRFSEDELDAVIAAQGASNTIAFGEPAEGITGFAASHHQALEAREIAVATGERTVRFGDFRVLVAMLRDSDLAKGFVERELGALARPDERTYQVCETLRVYLEHNQRVSATAAIRRRDRKTIARHLRSAEQLIRHRVGDRSDELLLALRVAEVLRNRAYLSWPAM